MDDDLLSWAMLGYALIAVGAASILIGWPLEGERGGVWPADPRQVAAMILAQQIRLLGAGDRVLARGVVPIDTDEGPPAVVCWNGDTFVLRGWCPDKSLDYRQARVMPRRRQFRGGSMTSLAKAAAADLKSYIERVERIAQERRELADAKANGFDPKAIRKIVKRRDEDPGVVQQEDAILEQYMHAIGMIPENPLAAAVAALAGDGLARDQVIEAFQKLVPMFGEIIANVGGDPMRIWRDETGKAYAEVYAPPKAKPEKTGRGLARPSAIVLELVPKAKPPADADPSDDDDGDAG